MAIEGRTNTGEPIRAKIALGPLYDQNGKYLGILMKRARLGIIVHYTSGTPTDNIERIAVLNDDSPIEDQLNSPDFNIQRISPIYMYTSKEDVVANKDVFYHHYREDDMYLFEDLEYEEDFHPLFDSFCIAWDAIQKGSVVSKSGRLDIHKPIDDQVNRRKLINAYLCIDRKDAQNVALRWNVQRMNGQPVIR